MCNWLLFQEREIRDMEKCILLAVMTVYDLNFSCDGRKLNIYEEDSIEILACNFKCLFFFMHPGYILSQVRSIPT